MRLRAGTIAVSGTDVSVPFSPPSGMSTTFLDDFDTLSLRTGGPTQDGYREGTGTWMPRRNDQSDPEGGGGYGEEEYYADPTFGFYNPFTIISSKLRIRAKRISGDWYSGYLASRYYFSQREGYVEARMKVPKGTGLWPAFWMLSPNTVSPPEIDVVEYRGNLPTQYHVAVNPDGSFLDSDPTTVDLSKAYHRYGLLRTLTTLTYYLDGVQVWSVDVTGKSAMLQPTYFILDLAVGSTGGFVPPSDSTTPDPADLYVDWVAAAATPLTNLWSHSTDFSDSSWTKNGITIANAGTSTQKILETATTDNHALNRVITKAGSAKKYRVYFDIKAGLGRSLARLSMTPSDYSSGVRVNFFADTGVVGDGGQYGDFSVVDGSQFVSFQPDGSKRCGFDFTTDTSTTLQVDLFVEPVEDSDVYLGDTNKGFFVTNATLVELVEPA